MWVRPCFAETPAWQDGVAVFRHGGDYNLGAILKTHYPAADENPPPASRFVHIRLPTPQKHGCADWSSDARSRHERHQPAGSAAVRVAEYQYTGR
ncbi:MAG: hypothetical protein ACLRWP_19615 [Bilophila wadsworthia]